MDHDVLGVRLIKGCADHPQNVVQIAIETCCKVRWSDRDALILLRSLDRMVNRVHVSICPERIQGKQARDAHSSASFFLNSPFLQP